MTGVRCTAIAMASILVAAVATSAPAVLASTRVFEPDRRACFCKFLNSSPEQGVAFIVTGERIFRESQFFLLVEKRYGEGAPALGEEVLLESVDLAQPTSLLLYQVQDRPDDQFVHYLQPGQTIRFIGSPDSGWSYSDTFGKYCTELRDADEVLTFIESIDFDYIRCLDGLANAVDLPEYMPDYMEEDYGCGSSTPPAPAIGFVLSLFAFWRLRRSGCVFVK